MKTIRQLLEEGNYQETSELCIKELEQNPTNDARYNLALTYHSWAYQKGNENPDANLLSKSNEAFENLIPFYENENVSVSEKHNNLFDVYMYLVEINFSLKLFDKTRTYINAAFGHNPYNYEANYRLASLTYLIDDIELFGKIAVQYFGFTGLEGDLDEGELFDKLYTNYQVGKYNEDTLGAILLAVNNSENATPFETFEDKINLCVFEFLPKYPDSILLHGFAGNLFYNNKDYNNALIYYEKTLGNPKAGTNWYARYIVSYIMKNGIAPKNLPEITDTDAVGVYSGTAILSLDAVSFENTPVYEDILNYKQQMFEKSFQLFEYFFVNGKGSIYCFNEHWFSMCCNDYGLLLKEKGEVQKALDIHKIGFHFSAFPAQLINALRCADKLKNATEISEIYKWYDENFGISPQSIGMVYFFEARYYLIMAMKYSNSPLEYQKVAIEDFLNEVNSNYDDYINAHIEENNAFFNEILNNLNSELLAIDANMSVTPESSLAIQQALQIAKKNPNNDSNWYVLFQMQHKNGLYKDCIHSANEYERSSFEMDTRMSKSEKFNFLFHKGSSLVRTENAQEGIPLLQEAEPLNANHYWTKHDLALGYFQSNQIDNALKYLEYCMNYYKKENLLWDNEIDALCRKVMILMDSKSDKKWVIKIANFILENVPKDTEAKALKKKCTNLFGF